MNVSGIIVELEFLAWRDAQFIAIYDQIEAAFPALREELSEVARSATLFTLVAKLLRQADANGGVTFSLMISD